MRRSLLTDGFPLSRERRWIFVVQCSAFCGQCSSAFGFAPCWGECLFFVCAKKRHPRKAHPGVWPAARVPCASWPYTRDPNRADIAEQESRWGRRCAEDFAEQAPCLFESAQRASSRDPAKSEHSRAVGAQRQPAPSGSLLLLTFLVDTKKVRCPAKGETQGGGVPRQQAVR